MPPVRAPAFALARAGVPALGALGVLGALGLFACASPASPAPGFGTAYAAASADGGAPPAFRSVRGSGAGDGWAVGEAGMAVALVGGAWIPTGSGTTATLGGLGTLDVAHAFAVELGGARVLAWDGRAWSPLGADRADRAAAATFTAGLENVWVVGDGIEHWDGQLWTQQVPGGAGAASTFTSIAGSFDTDVWAVGPAGVQHYDGHAWTPIATPAGTPPLTAVWVSSLENAWIVGAQGTLLEWNGNVLTRLPTGTTADLTAITGTGPTDVWAAGAAGTLIHFDGTTWTQLVTPAAHAINDVWAAFGGDVLLVDDTGVVTRYTP